MEAFALARKLVVATGFGLVLAASRLEVVRGGNLGSYSNDGTTYAFVIVLVAACAGLLLASVILEGERFLGGVSGMGAVLLGFFAFIPCGYLTHLGELRNGLWLGLGGSLLIALGAAPSALYSFSRSRARPGRAILVSRLSAVLGLGLIMVSLPLALTAALIPDNLGFLHRPSFWNSAGLSYGSHGNHELGFVLIALAALAAACLAAATLIRALLLEAWALAASLALLGVTAYVPVRLAFGGLNELRSGAVLGLIGALLAVGAMSVFPRARRIRENERDPG